MKENGELQELVVKWFGGKKKLISDNKKDVQKKFVF